MNYTIENVSNEFGLGYAFVDQYGHTIIMAYTENTKNYFINVLK